MKNIETILHEIRSRLERGWAATIVDPANTLWPHTFTLQTPQGQTLEQNFAHIHENAQQIQHWANTHNIETITATRKVYGTTQKIPTHLKISSFQQAMNIAGNEWNERTQTVTQQWTTLVQEFGTPNKSEQVIKYLSQHNATQNETLTNVCRWLKNNNHDGLTARQVPVPGVSSKWIETNKQIICNILHQETLNLLPKHPTRIHFTYLDPTHRVTGRHHDSATVGDQFAPPYQPDLIIISENKDTAIYFPPTKNAIAIEGGEAAPKACLTFKWIQKTPHIFYWGDMDSSGLQILNRFREAGMHTTSILMGIEDYHEYKKYGSDTDKHGNEIPTGKPQTLPHLTPSEQALYDQITDPTPDGRCRRIEQERIPLTVAHTRIQQALTEQQNQP